MVDVKPSIENIQRQSGGLFYTESDFMAELQRHANGSPQPDSRDLAAQPQVPSSQAEQDVMDELDALAAPNARKTRNSQQTPDVHAMNAEREQFSIARESSIGSVPDSLEDMLRVYNSYEASLSNSTAATPIIDLDGSGVPPIDCLSQSMQFGSSETTQSSTVGTSLDSILEDNVGTIAPPEPRRYAHTPAPETNSNASTINIPEHQSTRTTSSAQTSATTTNEMGRDPKSLTPQPNAQVDQNSNAKNHLSPAHPNEASNSKPETPQAESGPAAQIDDDWLMDSIEEYLTSPGGSNSNESVEAK